MRTKIMLMSFTIVLFLSGSSFAQSDDVDLNRDYLSGFITDTGALIISPSRWDNSDWLKATIFIGITAGLYAFDDEIQDWAQEGRNDTTDKVSDLARPFGEGIYTLPSLGLFYLYGHLYNDKRAKRVALLSVESLIITGVFTQTTKFMTHRHRPDGSSREWDGPGFSTTNLSFPSGHSSSAFAIASVIASEYKDKPIVPILSYSIATLTALSRVNDNKHWASDVFFGAGIGYFTGKAIVSLHTGKEVERLSILPFVSDEYSGIMAEYRF
ncbi:MAG: phosphatase PAP2 family protein [Thermodesulfovibrionia bacterium]